MRVSEVFTPGDSDNHRYSQYCERVGCGSYYDEYYNGGGYYNNTYYGFERGPTRPSLLALIG